jgi:hypothetical protein
MAYEDLNCVMDVTGNSLRVTEGSSAFKLFHESSAKRKVRLLQIPGCVRREGGLETTPSP